MPGACPFPKNWAFAWGNLEPHIIHGSKSQTASQSVQPFLDSSAQNILYNRPLLPPPSKLPFPMRGSGSHLIHRSLGPPESSTQTASRSVEPFFAGIISVTDHATGSVTVGSIYVRGTAKRHGTAMRPNNNDNNNNSLLLFYALRFISHDS